ncbi:MAG: diacylglycerol kinase family protein [Bacteroidales bacterium]|jgi:YegS/Rv2252/BmrU family lipid kinase
MEQFKKALFVLNPVSVGKRNKNISEKIKSIIGEKINHKIIIWENAKHDIGSIVKAEMNKENYDLIVAVGGDGTANEIASVLTNTNVTFALIPSGSGNGLARHLKIPMKPDDALHLLLNGKVKNIDTCYINEHPFFCTSGIGFDAHIGKLFVNSVERGFNSYLKIVINEVFNYKPKLYELEIDGNKISVKAFLITFANANQYGNNAVIAPEADIQDGIIEVTVIKPFNVFQAIIMAVRLFARNINKSCCVETYKAKNIKLFSVENNVIHFDGEQGEISGNLELKNHKQSLRVLVK